MTHFKINSWASDMNIVVEAETREMAIKIYSVNIGEAIFAKINRDNPKEFRVQEVEYKDFTGFANLYLHSDIVPFEILGRRGKRDILVRQMDARLNQGWAPEFDATRCTNNQTQSWAVTPSDTHFPFEVSMSRDKKSLIYKASLKMKIQDLPRKFHDYNF
jgi:hypothetical protein